MVDPTRRALLAAAAAAPLVGCHRTPPPFTGGWVGASADRGHRLRDLGKSGRLPPPSVMRRAGVLVVGAGVAGLACARALVAAGIDDVQLLELEDQAGGNSRGHRLAGMGCPLGAHYLPVPAESDRDLLALLESFDLCRHRHGKWVFDERHLCHSPQERLFFRGHWHEGLLPVPDDDPAALAAYRRFSDLVAAASREAGFALPTATVPWMPAHAALDAVTMRSWLDAQDLHHPLLRAYLDYCCRDDYGAGLGQVSAWAGLNYFASRHGFHAPGAEAADRDAVLTWPEGNGWLTARMAAPLQSRLNTGRIALRVEAGRDEVMVDTFDVRRDTVERWTAGRVVLATPLFVSARLLATPPLALAEAVSRQRHAPWLVANLFVDDALDDPPGAAPAWDNVIHGSPLLGYVNAMHQDTRPHDGPTVLTAYWALGGDDAATLQAQRARLMADPWRAWADAVVTDLAVPHPDLPAKVRQVDLMRYGHAMSIPVPGVRGSAALAALARPHGRLSFAHADLSGYSVFEEAYAHGMRAAREVSGRKG
ncbi:flavin monoamine oxidase family protein [Piscinibacter gummiphilus]|nr:NAD(P)/FAD-dependent oxidoreductase [Piscinibacter gummiphilus]GLS97145.1 monooxygenase [Piscinibacter gummiphilus]